MKKVGVLLMMLGLTLFLVGQQEEEPLRETVEVVNVEVPVRVYYKGKPVANLTRADFNLYENRKLQDIKGFICKRKRIKVQTVELTAEKKKTLAPRHFTLVFRIQQYSDDLKKGVEYVFENILKETDQVLVFANNKSAFFKNLKNKSAVKAKLDDLLRKESLETRHRLQLYFKALEQELKIADFLLTVRDRAALRQSLHHYIHDFFKKYLGIWNEFKKKYLVPDIDKYYNFSRYLKNILLEKWVINFYQFEMFPKIMVTSEILRRVRQHVGKWQASKNTELITFARLISRQMAEIEKEHSVAKDFPTDEVAKLFHNVDATFHSIFMRTTMHSLSGDVEYRRIASDLENNLRKITDLTGGDLVVSNKLDKALDTISEVEDIYYILTYEPTDPEKRGKIKVKLKKKKHKLVYSPNLRTGYLSDYIEHKEIKGKPLKIKSLVFKDKKLFMELTDIYLKKGQGGKLNIRIRIKNKQEIAIFDQQKSLNAQKDTVKLSLNFSGISKGQYDIIIDVQDMFTRKTDTGLLQVKIPD